MSLHDVITLLLIGAIVFFQCLIFIKTYGKIAFFKYIFPKNDGGYSTRKVFIPNEEINRISIENIEQNLDLYTDTKSRSAVEVIIIETDSTNAVFKKIVRSLNMYLLKNRGAVSDFHLIKDVVERNCDAEEEVIQVQQPIPMYLGLAGTMLGIIIGIGTLVLSGGLEKLMNGSDSGGDGITALMGGVAIAMISSFVGIALTTYASWKAKEAKSEIEASKNIFYSWIQTELLPMFSGDTTNALTVLQRNLMSFNDDFKGNVTKMNDALSHVSGSYDKQLELIRLIENIDIKQISKANISVLKELQNCTGEISTFNEYLHNVKGYLTQVNELNTNVNKHLDRTEAIEKMGRFFEDEIGEIEQRKSAMNQAVGKVDATLQQTFQDLREHSSQNIVEFKNSSIQQYDAFKKVLDEQNDEFKTRLDKTADVLTELQNLTSVKESIAGLATESQLQTQKMDALSGSINNFVEIMAKQIAKENARPRYAESSVSGASKVVIPTYLKCVLIGVAVILLLMFALQVYDVVKVYLA